MKAKEHSATNETDKNENPKPVLYYGKKEYRINPLLARSIAPETQTPDFRSENLDEKEANRS